MNTLRLDLTVRDLTAPDLAVCGWAGSGVPDGYARAQRGEVDYLVVCPPSGIPVATGGVNYDEAPGSGTLYQLHVHELLRNNGIGTLLIAAAEQRIRDRGWVGPNSGSTNVTSVRARSTNDSATG